MLHLHRPPRLPTLSIDLFDWIASVRIGRARLPCSRAAGSGSNRCRTPNRCQQKGRQSILRSRFKGGDRLALHVFENALDSGLTANAALLHPPVRRKVIDRMGAVIIDPDMTSLNPSGNLERSIDILAPNGTAQPEMGLNWRARSPRPNPRTWSPVWRGKTALLSSGPRRPVNP